MTVPTASAESLESVERARGGVRPAGRQPFLFVDLLAPLMVALYLVLKYEPFENTFRPPGAASSVLFPVAAVVVLVVTPTERLQRVPVSWPVLAFALWLVASRMWTEAPSSTDFLIRSELPALVLVALIAGTIDPPVLVRVLLVTFTVIVTWSLLTSIVLANSRAVVFDAGADEPQQGFRGMFGHKNQLGMFAVFGLGIVLAWVHGRRRRLLIVMFLATIVATRSATAASGLFIVLFLWFWIAAIDRQHSPRERAFLLLFSFMSAVTAVLVALRLLSTLLGLYQKDLTFSGRTVIWAESLKVLGRQPFEGYGFGGLFGGDPPGVTNALRRSIGFDAAHAHNGVIGLLLDAGIVGTALFAVVLGQAVVLVVHCLRRRATSDYGRWALLTVAALVLMSVSEPLFEGPDLGLLVIMIVVLLRVRNDARGAHARGTSASHSLAWRLHAAET